MPEDLAADVAIIGAGPTGAAAAWRLASAGLSVICLERGYAFDYAALGYGQPGYEDRRAMRFNENPNRRRAPEDYPIDDADSPIKPTIGNNVGGGSLYWAAHIPRFRPEDFRTHSVDGVGEDWPIGIADLEPYYDVNEARLGLAAVPGDPASPPRRAASLRLPSIGPCGQRFAAAFDALGWHWWPVDLAVGADAGGPDTPQCTHAGPCEPGCPARIRAGADRAYVQDAVAAGARLLTGARVIGLEHDGQDRVTAAVVAGPTGRHRVRAACFLLAANGIGTPRLLLMSASGRFADGLANRSGLVGRNLMLHPHARVDGLFPERLGAWIPGQKAGIVCLEFYATGRERGFVRGFKMQLGPSPTGLPWSDARETDSFDHIAGLTICAEDLPDPANRITLSADRVDGDGAPAAKMIYRLAENARHALDFAMERAEQVLRAAGAVAIARDPLKVEAGFHLMGTARMGRSAETSVVDPFGRCHDVANLFVIDSSVFVTSGAMNPTNTAQALALRTADHIIAGRRSGFARGD